jgi:SAM-dependent methyltransferase
MSSQNDDLARYYDRLGAYTRRARVFGWGGGSGELAVRRALRADDGTISPRTTENLVAEAAGALDQPRILDAGCGLGGLGLALLAKFGGTLHGITLSPDQARRAALAAWRMGRRARFAVASYDAPLIDGPYDLIVAVESLAHSRDLGRSLVNLARGLAAGGKLIVVDDLRVCGADDADARAFMAGWRTPSFVSEADWRYGFETAAMRIDLCRDLSPRIVHRDPIERRRLEFWNRAGHRWVPPLRPLLDSHWGGLALERLHARGAARYTMFVASL